MSQLNKEQFANLISQLLKDGWGWVGPPPSEKTLFDWAIKGRADKALYKIRISPLGTFKDYVHLLRGRREYAVIRYEITGHQIGEWSAWIESRRIN